MADRGTSRPPLAALLALGALALLLMAPMLHAWQLDGAHDVAGHAAHVHPGHEDAHEPHLPHDQDNCPTCHLIHSSRSAWLHQPSAVFAGRPAVVEICLPADIVSDSIFSGTPTRLRDPPMFHA